MVERAANGAIQVTNSRPHREENTQTACVHIVFVLIKAIKHRKNMEREKYSIEEDVKKLKYSHKEKKKSELENRGSKWKKRDCQSVRWNIRVKSESCSVESNSLGSHWLYSSWNSPGQNTGVDSLSLLQGSSHSRDRTQVSHIAGRFFTSRATREAQRKSKYTNNDSKKIK